MKYPTLRILSVFSALSLIGILITQTFWLRSSIELAAKQFNHRADKMLEDVIDELETYADTSIQVRTLKELGNPDLFDIVDTNLLDRLIVKYAEYHHLDSIVQFALVITDSRKIVYNKNNFDIRNEAVAYKVCLSCLWQKEYIHLSVFFPNKQRGIIQSQILWILLSIVFLLATVGAFIFILFGMFRQKKIAEIKNDFINNMTHELKTPISTISVAAEVLTKNSSENENNDRVTRYSKIIYDENHRMQKLVEKVLNIATLEKGLLTIEREEIGIHTIIFKSVESFRFEFCHKTVDVQYHFDAVDSVILADKVHIRNIINNLIDNSVKYSGDRPEIIIRTININGFIRIEIVDKGKGIPKEVQKKVFDKFYRAHSGNVHNVKGFGLGLYYVKTTVELHGGKIELESIPAQGTRIIMYLPQ